MPVSDVNEIERSLLSLAAPPELIVGANGIEVRLSGRRQPLERVLHVVESRGLLCDLRRRGIPTSWLFAQLPQRSRADTLPITDWDVELALEGAKSHESAMYLLELCIERVPSIGRFEREVAVAQLEAIWSVISNCMANETIRRSVNGFRLERHNSKITAVWNSRPIFSTDFGEFVKDCAISGGFRELPAAEAFRDVFIEELFAAEIDLASLFRLGSSDSHRLLFEVNATVPSRESVA